VGFWVKLSDTAEGGTTGGFSGVDLVSAGFSKGRPTIIVVALVGGNSKTFWEFKVEI